MKKWSGVLNSIMGGACGWFLGQVIWIVYDFKKHPEIYAIQSAPWYSRILTGGGITLVILLVCLVVKAINKYRIKKSKSIATE